MGDPHSLLHSNFVQLFEVIGLGDILRLSLSLVVQKGSVVVGNALVVFDVAKHVEKLLIVGLGVLELFRCVVLEVAIGASLTRLVRLISL